MTPLERPSRARVIESFRGTAQPLPTDEREGHAGVIGMAARAALRFHRRRAVQTALAVNQPGNLLVTVEAQAGHLLLAAAAATAVTFGALQRALELGVRACQWSWRDLAGEKSGSTEEEQR